MKDNKLLKKNFSKDLLNRIKKEKVKRIPKCVFIFKHISVWFFLVFSIIIGAISLSISFGYLVNADWYLVHKLGMIKIAIIFMPFFWILFLMFASILSYYNFRHTERGYKFSFGKILGVNITLSIVLGFLLYFIGMNHLIEGKMEEFIPKYRGILVEDKVSRMIKVWQNEESGLILGKIIQLSDDNSLKLIDYNNKNWTIFVDKKSDIKGRVNLIVGEKVKIIGEKIDDDIFKAIQIRPFIGKKQSNKKEN